MRRIFRLGEFYWSRIFPIESSMGSRFHVAAMLVSLASLAFAMYAYFTRAR